MLLLGILGTVFGAGCIGGVVNSLVAGELQLPRIDRDANVYRPGWIGSTVVGGIAALAFWGFYGPFSEAVVIGAGVANAPSLTLGELFGSLITGIGGGRVLMNEVDKRALRNQNQALSDTRDDLADSIAKVTAVFGGR